MIAIFSVSEDLHALIIQDAVHRLGYHDVCIVEVDRIANGTAISMAIGQPGLEQGFACITSREGKKVPIEDLSLIWLRRPKAEQLGLDGLNATERKFINNECRGVVEAVLSSLPFQGRWVSSPAATLRASDKLFQLQVAHGCGFQIPKTLVTQSRDEVLAFHVSCKRLIIAKPLIGVAEPFLVTQRVEDPASLPPEAFSICPAIYQELIPGTRHVRLNCFGDTQVAALIESQDLDWRPNLRVPVSPWTVPDEVRACTRRLLDALGLEMGVFDFKETPDGELIFLEVNPQGQFLFLSPLLQQNLAETFARFLIESARAQGGARAVCA